jgi:hypothetical protein
MDDVPIGIFPTREAAEDVMNGLTFAEVRAAVRLCDWGDPSYCIGVSVVEFARDGRPLGKVAYRDGEDSPVL